MRSEDKAAPTSQDPLISESSTEQTPLNQAKKVGATLAKVDYDSELGDVLCTFTHGLLCFIHPCASFGLAVGTDGAVATARRVCGKKDGQPYTVNLSNAIDAHNSTRHGESIKPTDVLPCGAAGVLTGMAVNLFKGKIPNTDASTAVNTAPPVSQAML